MPKPKKTKAASLQDDVGKNPDAYAPTDKDEVEMRDFLEKRVPLLKDMRKKRLPGLNRNIEDIWRDADREYSPHELGLPDQGRRFESDDETGLRSRLVKVGDETQWQSDSADPVFYVKVTTALSILIEQNPEAVFLPASGKYQKNTAVAYANWKASWENTNAKQQVKLFIFNQAKYGTGFGRTYPKLVTMKKRIRTEYYPGQPEKDKYVEKNIIKFNDVCRSAKNNWKVWTSENARPGNPESMDDWYYEENYSWDKFQQEFPAETYPNAHFVKRGSLSTESKSEGDTETEDTESVTVGFYENQVKDRYAVYIPAQKIVLYHSPLTNDDGMVSLWTAPWSLRHDESIYGIGIYEIIRQDAALYDRVKNMTVDQLTLMIYKMFFHKGLDQLGQNGKLVVTPGKGEQVTDPASIKFLEVPGPGVEAWKGLQFIQDKVDTNSGVPQQLTGKFTGNTLGQDMQAKEIALQRMKTPLDYILDALQQEAYISLSWMKQTLSVPEVYQWNTQEELEDALEEAGLSEEEIKMYLNELQAPNPSGDLFHQEAPEPQEPQLDPETGEPTEDQPTPPEPQKYVNVYKEVSLGVEKDDKGELIESEKNRFYRFGLHLPLGRLDWKGIVRVKPQSVLAPSRELEKRNDLDMYNLVFPSIQAMAANPMLVPVLMPPIKQIVKIFDKDINDWIDVKHFEKLYEMAQQPKEAPVDTKASLSIAFKDIPPQEMVDPIQKEVLEKYLGVKIELPLFVNKGGQPASPGSVTALPNQQPPEQEGETPTSPQEGAPQIEPVADMAKAPTSLGGAVAAAQQGR